MGAGRPAAWGRASLRGRDSGAESLSRLRARRPWHVRPAKGSGTADEVRGSVTISPELIRAYSTLAVLVALLVAQHALLIHHRRPGERNEDTRGEKIVRSCGGITIVRGDPRRPCPTSSGPVPAEEQAWQQRNVHRRCRWLTAAYFWRRSLGRLHAIRDRKSDLADQFSPAPRLDGDARVEMT